jgi:hypothetical protein
MKGVNYLTDQKGKKTAVVIDLKKYGDEVEDFLDGLEAASRAHEPSVDFKKAVTKIIKAKSKRGLSNQNKKVG